MQADRTDPPAQLGAVPAGALTPGQLALTERLYEESFPPQLRVPFAELATPTATTLMLVAVDSAEPVGFAALMLLLPGEWTFLRYYGVTARRRRQGIGREFWGQLVPAIGAASWPTRIVFEVEDPREIGIDAAERQVRINRIAFWQACGAQLLPVDGYVMPQLTSQATAEPMQLMVHDATARADLPAGDVAELVSALYTIRYGLAADDPLLLSAVASIPER
jgi:hypothetical protein